MTTFLPLIPIDDIGSAAPTTEPGAGRLGDERGGLPLVAMDVVADVCGLVGTTRVRQVFRNDRAAAIEATYVFPLPDRAAVTRFSATLGGRLVEGVLQERSQARQAYDEAVALGHRAAIAEEDRAGVFTTRVGNLLPGEQAVLELVLTGPLAVEQGEATYRFPLVVAPRYVPGEPLPGPQAGDGTALDTDSAPDASRITPPVLVPGQPNPVALSLVATVRGAGLDTTGLRSSLHAVVVDRGPSGPVSGEGGPSGPLTVRLAPGERLDRDVILRLPVMGEELRTMALSAADASDATQGTWSVTVVPPRSGAGARHRAVALLLDRSGSMGGWKLVAARRAAARVVDALGSDDRFCLLAFDHAVEHPTELGAGLIPATDRNRFAAVRWLGGLEARGGTELLDPLVRAAGALAGDDSGRDRMLVLVTDGQVANEDQVLRALADRVGSTRVFTLGVDQAVNGAFLQRIAAVGAGRCDLVEGEDRLDEVLAGLHRRISPPVLRDVRVEALAGGSTDGLVGGSVVPDRAPDCFAAGPVTVAGRWSGSAPRQLRVTATTASAQPWETTVTVTTTHNPAVRAVWARAHVRDLEDRYAAGASDLAATIVQASLDHGVLSRFTAFVAVDRSQVTASTAPVAVIQPVELPGGWLPTGAPGGAMPCAAMPLSAMAAAPLAGGTMAAAPPPAAKVARGLHRRALSRDDEQAVAPSQPPDVWAPWRSRVSDLLDRLEADGPSAGLLADLTTLVDDLESVGDPGGLAAMVRLLVDALGAGRDPTTAATKLRTALGGRPQSRRRAFWR